MTADVMSSLYRWSSGFPQNLWPAGPTRRTRHDRHFGALTGAGAGRKIWAALAFLFRGAPGPHRDFPRPCMVSCGSHSQNKKCEFRGDSYAADMSISVGSIVGDLLQHQCGRAGTLYAMDDATNALYTIDPNTYALTLVGNTGVGGDFGDLACNPAAAPLTPVQAVATITSIPSTLVPARQPWWGRTALMTCSRWPTTLRPICCMGMLPAGTSTASAPAAVRPRCSAITAFTPGG